MAKVQPKSIHQIKSNITYNLIVQYCGNFDKFRAQNKHVLTVQKEVFRTVTTAKINYGLLTVRFFKQHHTDVQLDDAWIKKKQLQVQFLSSILNTLVTRLNNSLPKLKFLKFTDYFSFDIQLKTVQSDTIFSSQKRSSLMEIMNKFFKCSITKQ